MCGAGSSRSGGRMADPGSPFPTPGQRINAVLKAIPESSISRSRAKASASAPKASPRTPSVAPNPDPRHIMNPNRCSLFVPETIPVVIAKDLTFGRPPPRRLWRGCAALLAGGEGRPRSGPRGTRRNFRGRLVPPSDVGGMERKSPSPTFFTERTLAAYLAVSDRTIRNWIRRGQLPSYKLGAARRIDPADVEHFLARHRDKAA